ncbi:MAG: hypothetical protein KDA45_12480 [Planctomycetales bacterium]|nr:hypothetical protein [Planctomycetales bacterium]
MQNPKIKRVVRLREATARRKSHRFLIDGAAEIRLAHRCGIELETVFFDATDSADFSPAAWPELGPRWQPVAGKVLSRMSYGQREHCPLAVAVTPRMELGRLSLQPGSVLLVLDRTEKPGNLGACLRTAAACGVDAVVLTDPVCELFNPNAIRASRGAIFSLPIAVSNRRELQDLCQRVGIPLLAARVDGSGDLWQQDFRSGAALVFGSEAHGLGAEWQEAVEVAFKIPMRGVTDSLNLSISTAVTLYEVYRQRSTL